MVIGGVGLRSRTRAGVGINGCGSNGFERRCNFRTRRSPTLTIATVVRIFAVDPILPCVSIQTRMPTRAAVLVSGNAPRRWIGWVRRNTPQSGPSAIAVVDPCFNASRRFRSRVRPSALPFAPAVRIGPAVRGVDYRDVDYRRMHCRRGGLRCGTLRYGGWSSRR